MKILIAVIAGAVVSTSLSAQTLPDQSVPTAQTAPNAANQPQAPTPTRARPRVRQKSGFFGLPLLALAAAGVGGAAAAATSGGGNPASTGGGQ